MRIWLFINYKVVTNYTLNANIYDAVFEEKKK